MKKAVLWLDKYVEEGIMLILLAFMLILMGVQVFMRYFIERSLSWPEELIRFSFIWFVFLGLSYGVKHGIHLKVDLLEMTLPRLKGILNVIQDVFFLAFAVFMIQPALSAVGMLKRSGQTSPALSFPMYIVYLSLLFGFILTVFRIVQKWHGLLRPRSVAPEREGEP